ncbi:MAG: thymidylate synthase [Planctomycetes bacterium]|nr:thymidylate synthase [Planctomycetota bacterium]
MKFEAVYYADKITAVNEHGVVGLLTLWSRVPHVISQLQAAGCNLDPDSSPICGIANLYGDGIPELTANLHYNPQIKYLIVTGSDAGNSRASIKDFYERNFEPLADDDRLISLRTTDRRLPALIGEKGIPPSVELIFIDSIKDVAKRINTIEFDPSEEFPRSKFEIPKIKSSSRPSLVGGHQLIASSIVEAYIEVLHTLALFGKQNHGGGNTSEDRLELMNVKVLVEDPVSGDYSKLSLTGYPEDEIRNYQREMYSPEKADDQDYTYGNRMREYFGVNQVQIVIDNLKNDRAKRNTFISLWDPISDPFGEEVPCLVTVFFRVFDDKLHLSATYRAHNGFSAWLKNVYGLANIQTIVSKATGIPVGTITIVSHSISIRASKLSEAQTILKKRRYKMVEDPNGFFRIGIDGGVFTCNVYNSSGTLIEEISDSDVLRVARIIEEKKLVSDIGHAIYIGRQLQQAKYCLENGIEYIQDS